MRTIRGPQLLVTAVLGALALPAVGHHGWAGQGNDLVDVSGTVHKAVQLLNPHSSMQLMVDGQVWDVTLPTPNRAESAGLAATTLAVGDKVTVRGNRNNDAKRFEIKAVRLTASGKNYDLYPERLR